MNRSSHSPLTVLAILATACGGFSAPVDYDSDGVADVDDSCPNVAGEAELQFGDASYPGCPNPDVDSDGFVTKIPGGLFWSLDTVFDQCPDVAGKNQGCPEPTPEVKAFDSWSGLHNACQQDKDVTCLQVMPAFAALAAADQTSERKALAEADVQVGLAWDIRNSSLRPEHVDVLKGKLVLVTDEAKRTELGIKVEKGLWLWLYNHCSRDSGACDPTDDGQVLTRVNAFAAVGSLGYYDKAFPEAGLDLVRYVHAGTFSLVNCLDAALDVGLTEQQFRDVVGLLDRESFSVNLVCTGEEDFFVSAAKVGWLRDVPEWCVLGFVETHRYRDAIAFLAGAGREDLRPGVHQALSAAAYRYGMYRIVGGQPVVDVEVDNYTTWGGG